MDAPYRTGEHPLLHPHLHDGPPVRLWRRYSDPPAEVPVEPPPLQQERCLTPVGAVVPAVLDLGGCWRRHSLGHGCWQGVLPQYVGPVCWAIAVETVSAVLSLNLSCTGGFDALGQRLPAPRSHSASHALRLRLAEDIRWGCEGGTGDTRTLSKDRRTVAPRAPTDADTESDTEPDTAGLDRPDTGVPDFSAIERVRSDLASDELLTDLRGER